MAIVLAGYLAFSPRLARSSAWRATVTPLASIMGSGFLVCAALLGGTVGDLAIVCMAALLALAYAVGAAIRFNIRHFEPIENANHGPAQTIALLSRIVLGGAYFISVTYYLQLLSAFLTNAWGIENETAPDVMTSVLLIGICGVGMWRGLGMLERVEKYTVALNLGTIAALLVALAIYNGQLMGRGDWTVPDISSAIDFHDVRVLLGLLIVVQGFETSRYLGDEHSADERIATMRYAQLLSSAIYLVFIGLVTVLFDGHLDTSVTAITNMTLPVAIVLPVLISIAAIGSEFSALGRRQRRGRRPDRRHHPAPRADPLRLSLHPDGHAGVDLGDRRLRHHRLCLARLRLVLCAAMRGGVSRGPAAQGSGRQIGRVWRVSPCWPSPVSSCSRWDCRLSNAPSGAAMLAVCHCWLVQQCSS